MWSKFGVGRILIYDLLMAPVMTQMMSNLWVHLYKNNFNEMMVVYLIFLICSESLIQGVE